jgi:hypothetical protein
MTNDIVSNVKKKLWTRLLGEDSWTRRHGDFRAREAAGLVSRPNYCYGMLRAADVAKYFGKRKVTVLEFGVASGNGLLNMIDNAREVTRETGVEVRVVGFDTGAGLPELGGYKDHPELWNGGDFAMEDRETLVKKIAGRAEIVWGDIRETLAGFMPTVDESAPIGFISVDVDIYSASKAALGCLTGPPEHYNPAVSMYFDDVGFFFANEWAGELAAIAEFNNEQAQRKIGRDRSLPGRRPKKAEGWYDAMYACHILDHEARQKPRDRGKLTIGKHHDFMSNSFLY